MQPTNHSTVIVQNQPIIPQLTLSKKHKIIRGINFAAFPVLFISFAISGFVGVSLFISWLPLIFLCLFLLNMFICAGHNKYLNNRNVRHWQAQQSTMGTGVTVGEQVLGVPVAQPGAPVLHPPPTGPYYVPPTGSAAIPANAPSLPYNPVVYPPQTSTAPSWPSNLAMYPPHLPDQSVAPPVSAGVGNVHPVQDPDLPPSYDQVVPTQPATFEKDRGIPE